MGAPPRVDSDIAVFQVVPESTLTYKKVAPEDAATAITLPSGEASASRIPLRGGLERVALKAFRSTDSEIVFSWFPAPALLPQPRTSCGTIEPETGLDSATIGLLNWSGQWALIRVQLAVPVAW